MSLNKWFDIALSYSKKRTLLECPHKYELQYIRKVQPRAEERRFILPNSVDGGLNLWIKQGFQGALVEHVLIEFDKKAESVTLRWRDGEDKPTLRNEAISTAAILEKVMRENGLCPSAGAISQKYIKVAVNDILITGYMDVYYKIEHEIYDLKTTKDKKWLDWNQLYFYDWAASIMMGRKIKKVGFLAPLMREPVQTKVVGKEEWGKVINEINVAVKLMEGKEFPATGDPSKDCYMCLLKFACTKYNRPINVQNGVVSL